MSFFDDMSKNDFIIRFDYSNSSTTFDYVIQGIAENPIYLINRQQTTLPILTQLDSSSTLHR